MRCVGLAMRNLSRPTQISLALFGLILLLLFGFWLSQRGDNSQDRPTSEQAASATRAKDDLAQRCASQRTYDLIKRNLFRQAARVRGSDEAAFGQLAAYSSARVESPLVISGNPGGDRVGCTARLSLDLPPGVEVVGGRRTLSADIQYSLQPAADGTGDVVLIKGADPIVIPLATLARVRSSQPTQPPAPMEPEPLPQQLDPLPTPSIPPAASQAGAQPSFDCRVARTGGEIAVCRNEGLAALDRQMAAQYQRAIAAANPAERNLLQRTRDDFLRYRDRCGNNDCVASTYRGRMREIDDIMAGRWQPRRR